MLQKSFIDGSSVSIDFMNFSKLLGPEFRVDRETSFFSGFGTHFVGSRKIFHKISFDKLYYFYCSFFHIKKFEWAQ